MERDNTQYRTEEHKEIQRINTTKLWEDAVYREKISKAVSKGQKASWATGIRKQGKKVPIYSKYLELLNIANYEMLTPFDEFIISGVVPTIKCNNGHLFKSTYKKFKNAPKCYDCIIEDKLKEVGALCDRRNYEIAAIHFKKARNSLNFHQVDIICDKGHMWNNVHVGNLLRGFGCRHCKTLMTISETEYEIKNFLDLYNIKHIQSDRTLIAPYELDFIFPEYKIALEFDGFPYHTEGIGGISRDYHLMKTEMCEAKGYQLIHIFWDEWEEPLKQITMNKLLHIFGKDENVRIYARKCEIKLIDTNTYRNFCKLNHLQGYAQASIKLGLFYENCIVSVMSFSKPNRAKGNLKNKENVWELSRACSNCNVVGGASKLLNYFKTHYVWDKIFTYADRRWSIGNVYEKIGFTFVRNTQANYWYINKQREREYRYKYRKSQLNGIGTEWDQMIALGYDRIWDCGHKLYEMNR